jgi:hypothetical protein
MLVKVFNSFQQFMANLNNVTILWSVFSRRNILDFLYKLQVVQRLTGITSKPEPGYHIISINSGENTDMDTQQKIGTRRVHVSAKKPDSHFCWKELNNFFFIWIY